MTRANKHGPRSLDVNSIFNKPKMSTKQKNNKELRLKMNLLRFK